MAIRTIAREGEEVLRGKARKVTEFDERLWQLLDDMRDTMQHANGVGLAGPQVFVRRAVVTIDVGEGLIELINPVITARSQQEEEDIEGCLSCPGEWGYVKRPQRVTVTAQDRFGKPFTLECEGLLARAVCHETDHLEGQLFKDIVTRMCDPSELEDD